uniref:Nematode cuticle collagen N-terminal domain-containing protein n=1 Tax=Ditylenchus dipsaci TaxID=166011 RepID=A0A915E2M9_9BILA
MGCLSCSLFERKYQSISRSSSTQRSVPRLLTRTPTKMEHKQPIIVEYKEETEEHRQLRRVAFFAIVISTAAVIVSIVTLPMLYSYVAGFQSHLIQETEFCKTRSRDMWTEMSILHQQGHSSVRAKRQYGNSPQPAPAAGGYGPAVNPDTAPSCCSCQQGPPGPAGPTGDAGEPGSDGSNGQDGNDGRDGNVLKSAIPHEPCVICPPGPPGNQGASGQKGPRGPKGAAGENGKNGDKGDAGLQGPIGLQGPVGPPDLTDPLELQEDLSKSTAQPDHKAPQEHQELLAKRVFPAKTAPTLVAESVQLETTEHQDLKEPPDLRDPPDLKDQMESPAAANIVHLHEHLQAIKLFIGCFLYKNRHLKRRRRQPNSTTPEMLFYPILD